MRHFSATLGSSDAEVFAPTPGQFDRSVFRAVFPSGQLYGLDVETTYMGDLGQFDPDFRIRLVQFATVGYAWVLDVSDPEQRDAAIELLADETVSLCSHTNMDVLSTYTQLAVDISARNIDTWALAAMADPDRVSERDLKTLAREYLGPELAEADAALYARFKMLWPGRRNAKRSEIEAYGWREVSLDDPVYLTYAGLDAIACRRLVDILAPATYAPPALVKIETWLATQANRIQQRGMRVDRDALDVLHSEAVRETTAAEAVISELTEGIKARSPKVIDWLGEHGADWAHWPGALTESGKPSLAKGNVYLLLAQPLDEPGRTVAAALVRFKGHLDALNKTQGILDHLAPDGRVHPALKTLGAVTARMTSSGPNFQNFNKRDPRHRGVFIPEPGHVFVTIDFDQVELRVVAALAGEAKMVETIKAGGDLHQLTVDEIAQAGITITRDGAKVTNFLIVYGGGASALHAQTETPLWLAEQIIDAHRSRYPAITDYARRLGRQRSSIRTMSHRRLPVTVNRKTGQVRSYANINYAVQSAARDLLVDAWHRFATEFGRAELVWYPVHDELVLQVPEGLVKLVISEAQRCMRFEFRGVPITATAIALIDTDGQSRWMTSKRAAELIVGCVRSSCG